jgi:hypothetical protein
MKQILKIFYVAFMYSGVECVCGVTRILGQVGSSVWYFGI